LKLLQPDVRYEVIHVRTPLGAATPEVREVISAVLADVEAGRLQPLPWKQFALGEATEAFRYMAAGQHTGRVLLAPHLVAEKVSKTALTGFSGFRRDGAYVVSGGFAGLGLLVVEWLAQKGAGCVLALGRSEPSLETRSRLDRLMAQGTEVVCVRCDVSDDAALAEALGAIPAEFVLRGVFHCAGVWENAALPNQTVEKYRAALAGKLAGAWNLHRLTRPAALDCFVLFSSVAGLMGSRGQSNYAAANAYLDALAHFRRDRLGLTALSVNWGAWSGTGAAVRHGMTEKSERSGAAAISPAEGLDLLLRLMQEDLTQVLASRIDWKKWALHWPAETAANADLLAGVLPSSSVDGDRVASADVARGAGQRVGIQNWREQLLAAQAAQRRPMLAARVEERVRTVLSLGGRQSIDSARPLQEYGMDSLLSIELRNALSTDFGIKLSATALFDYPTLGGLTNWLFDDVLKLRDSDPSREAETDQPLNEGKQDVLAGVAALTDDEVERLFQEKMAGQGK
jgi:NAD(P)-dependent dehydrogenase (short-subunit alcohol dehydrogenase family)/acyl carrier protein